jgi:hypothetical protein
MSIFGYIETALSGQTNPSGGDVFIRGYDAAGTEFWTEQFGTDFDVEVGQVLVDSTGIYITGQVNGAFAGQTDLGGGDAFVAKYDFSGSLLWLEQFGSSSFDKATGLTLDLPAIYVVGYTTGSLPGQISSGKNDVFLRKYVQDDTDNDGIWDEIDTQALIFSNDFSDISLGGTTSGTITSRGGQILTVKDATNSSDGVFIKADASGGPPPAKISACGGAIKVNFSAGDSSIITCSSAKAEVLSGPIEFSFIGSDGRVATSSLGAGYSLTFYPEDFSFAAGESNPDTLSLTIDGEEVSLAPDQEITAKNHGLYVSSLRGLGAETIKEAALSRVGMPEQSRK